MTVNRADIETILQIAQQGFVLIDHGHFIGFFARQMLCRCAPDLSGAKNNNLHTRNLI